MRGNRAEFDQRLDELYRERPEDFVATRDELVKELRADGDRDGAERLKKLRRPTATAWLINRVALDSPELLERVRRGEPSGRGRPEAGARGR